MTGESHEAEQAGVVDTSAGAAAATLEPKTVEPKAEQGEPAVAPVVAARPISPHADKFRWYVVQAHAGFEGRVKQALDERIRTFGFGDFFGDIHVPQETVVELVRGQKKKSNRKFFPGYVLIQMVLNEDTWHLVKETPKVSGFLGDATAPEPLSEEEVKHIQNQEEGGSESRTKVTFEQGETVKIIDGPFTEFVGTIEEVRPDKGKVKVLISIFGRATPVELDFVQVERSLG